MLEPLPGYDAWKLATPPEHREAPDDLPIEYYDLAEEDRLDWLDNNPIEPYDRKEDR